MPTIHYIQADGTERAVQVPVGTSVMEGAIQNDIDGIVAECGGSCMCATCHVYVDDAFLDRLSPIDESEDEMLDCAAAERRPNSRLGCQIPVSEELDNLIVRLPEEQQ